MAALIHTRNAFRVSVLAFTLTALLVFLPATASAQTLPPICDQYPHLPVCAEDAGGGPDGDRDDEAGLPGAGAGGPGAGAGAGGPGFATGDAGTLPFTGYPLTPLLLLLILLLAAGAAVRALVAARDRLGRQADAPLNL